MKLCNTLFILTIYFTCQNAASEVPTNAPSFSVLTEADKNTQGQAAKIIIRYKDKVSLNYTKAIVGDEIYYHSEKLKIIGTTVGTEQLAELKSNSDLKIEFDENLYLPDEIDPEQLDLSKVESTEQIPYGIRLTHQNDINFFRNLGTPTGSAKLCVADTGYNLGHTDLPKLGNVIGRDNTENGDWDEDPHGHGTHVAGTINAIGGNNIGVTSVIPNNANGKFQLIISKALNNGGSGSWTSILEAIESCVVAGANVINLSLGGYSISENVEDGIREFYEEEDVLFIAAAGNGYSSSFLYPASFPAVISVAAVDSTEQRASFSNYNNQVEISGPGVSVLSTYRSGTYSYLSGTSMASPHVAGVAGLLRMYFPQCKNYHIRNALIRSAKDLGSSGCDILYGHGLVQSIAAYNFLKQGNCGSGAVEEPLGGCSQAPPLNGPTPIRSPTPIPTPVPFRFPTPFPTPPPSGSPTHQPSRAPGSPTPSPTPQPVSSPNANPTPAPTPRYNAEWTKVYTTPNENGLSVGYRTDISKDGFTIATIVYSYVEDSDSFVRVLRYDTGINQWVQLGSDIIYNKDDELFGYAISLSGDGKVVAAGYHQRRDKEKSPGETVCIYKYNEVSREWNIVGACIWTEFRLLPGINTISMSYDGSVVCVALWRKNEYVVRSYKFSTSTNRWEALGSDILTSSSSWRDFYVSLSSDGKTVAITAEYWKMEVFSYSEVESSWKNVFSTFEVDQESSLSDDGKTVAALSRYSYSSSVVVFSCNNVKNEWEKLGYPLSFNHPVRVSLSGDGRILAVLAYVYNTVKLYYFSDIMQNWLQFQVIKRDRLLNTHPISSNGDTLLLTSYDEGAIMEVWASPYSSFPGVSSFVSNSPTKSLQESPVAGPMKKKHKCTPKHNKKCKKKNRRHGKNIE